MGMIDNFLCCIDVMDIDVSKVEYLRLTKHLVLEKSSGLHLGLHSMQSYVDAHGL